LLCVIGARLLEFGTFLHLAREDRVEAAAFALAAIGTVSGHLVVGLGAGLLLHAIGRFARRGSEAQARQIKVEREQGVRAVLQSDRAGARRPAPYEAAPEAGSWLANIRQRAQVSSTAYVHRQATVIGRVVLGEHVHIAAGSSVRADEGSPFFIGSNSNIQDGVVIHALKNKRVRVGGEEWAVYVGRNVSIAHDALVHGPCYVGDDTFIGFKAVVHDSVVGSHCYVGIGAVVVGVEVPDGRFVPHGTIVDSADKVAALPLVTEAHREFNEDVVDVNRGLAVAYQQHHRALAGPAVGVAPAARRPAAAWEQDWDSSAYSERF
jgi:SulP family sulfate permease